MKLVELEGLDASLEKMRYFFVNPDHVVTVSANYEHKGCSTLLLVGGAEKIVNGHFDVVAEQLCGDDGIETVRETG